MSAVIRWLAIVVIIVIIIVKWGLGLYGALDDAIAWIKRRFEHASGG